MKTKKAAIPTEEQVSQFMNQLEHPFKSEVEALRKIIRNANPKIAERIKWNAPSYFYIADMAAFNLHAKKYVQIIFIFPKGLINDNSGLLQGEWKDRREAKFYDMLDVESKKSALEKVVNDWVRQMDE